MIKKLLIFSMLYIYGSNFSQVPHGAIVVDVKFLLNNEQKKSLANKKDLEKVLSENNISIYPVYSFISKSKNNDSLKIAYFQDPDLIMFEKTTLDIDESITGLYDGWVNFLYNKDVYYVTKIQKSNEEMILYLYVGNAIEYLKDNQKYFEILNVYYDLENFIPGTYYINLQDIKFNNNFSKYYRIGNDNSYLYIKNEAINSSKISENAISPEKLQRFYKDKNLKKSATVQKILSVFEE